MWCSSNVSYRGELGLFSFCSFGISFIAFFIAVCLKSSTSCIRFSFWRFSWCFEGISAILSDQAVKWLEFGILRLCITLQGFLGLFIFDQYLLMDSPFAAHFACEWSWVF